MFVILFCLLNYFIFQFLNINFYNINIYIYVKVIKNYWSSIAIYSIELIFPKLSKDETSYISFSLFYLIKKLYLTKNNKK